MSFRERFLKIFNKIEDVLMPFHSCIACGKEIPDGSNFQICKECLLGIEFIGGNICSKCGEKLIEGSLLCDYCKDFNYHFDKNISCCYYDDAAAKIIKDFKFKGKKFYAEYIAKVMMSKAETFDNIDYITFVPITKKRLKERGYNQAELLANIISEKINVPVKNLLEKVTDGKHQVKLNQEERLKNLVDSFKVNDDEKINIKGKNILIIDDVFTTGTTLSECAKALKSAKLKKIVTLTFAKTRFKPNL